ncbi:hypothetical protein ACI5KX_11835 [Erythrobacter sp. GH1-10]|uniref:hypothetical protein n=1 Tax=Erythrobacter sp. GH1-10 TaxID=3349334 RepID=UPI0038780023
MNAALTFAGKAALRLRAVTKRYSRLLMILAALLFTGGIIASILTLDVTWTDLDPAYFALLALVLAPLGVLLGALNMVVLARSTNIPMSLRDATYYCVFAQLAEILPIPGGAIVRGGALVARGAGASMATTLVLTNALLWVGCAALAAGFSLGIASQAGAILGASGALGVFLCCAILAKAAGIRWMLAALGIRIAGLVLVGLRLAAAFLALGVAMSLLQAYPFALASILGSASSIAPGGLGISEALAAGMATLSAVTPGAAFLAVAINRIVSFAVSGVFFAAFQLADGYRAPSHG